MPNTDEMYPDKFMKAKHLEEMAENPDQENWPFKIRSTGIAEYQDGKKQLMLGFYGTHLELGLNKGNATALADIFNSVESDDWVGKTVVLKIEIVKNNFVPAGKGPAIRINEKQTRAANRPKQVAKQVPSEGALAARAGKATEPITQADVDKFEDMDGDGDDLPF